MPLLVAPSVCLATFGVNLRKEIQQAKLAPCPNAEAVLSSIKNCVFNDLNAVRELMRSLRQKVMPLILLGKFGKPGEDHSLLKLTITSMALQPCDFRSRGLEAKDPRPLFPTCILGLNFLANELDCHPITYFWQLSRSHSLEASYKIWRATSRLRQQTH